MRAAHYKLGAKERIWWDILIPAKTGLLKVRRVEDFYGTYAEMRRFVFQKRKELKNPGVVARERELKGVYSR
jgi:hypothetical protein